MDCGNKSGGKDGAWQRVVAVARWLGGSVTAAAAEWADRAIFKEIISSYVGMAVEPSKLN